MKIVLASESPFRKRALDLIGLPYETRPSRIDEKTIRDDNPADLTRKLAEAKACKIATRMRLWFREKPSQPKTAKSSRSPVTSKRLPSS
jgi:predicted house-cleaning NTP pyrophosphatase (Maf/HAM1 superfamily)